MNFVKNMNLVTSFLILKSALFLTTLLNIGFCSPLEDIATNSSFASAFTDIANNLSQTEKVTNVIVLDTGLSLLESNLSSQAVGNNNNGSLSENKSGGNYYDDDGDDDEKESDDDIGTLLGRNRGMRSEKKKEKMRLALLKQIQSLDHMKCFPKVLCGLSVDSSKNSKDIDSYFVRSYIQLMRSANPEVDSSEETTKTSSSSSDPKNDALSIFLMKSGLLKPKRRVHEKRPSHSASSSDEEGSDERQGKRHKSLLEMKNEALKSLLSKRRLSSNDKHIYRLRPGLKQNQAPIMPLDENPSSVTSQISSLMSSWVPWVNLSFDKDSFEKDPFFKGGDGSGASKVKDKKEREKEWQKNLDKLAMLMAVKEAEIWKRLQKNKSKSRPEKEGRSLKESRDVSSTMDDEIKVYSTAVEIGKKLKDAKQCDYLYNGCPVTYANIIKIIASIRKDNVKESDETVESLSKEILEYSQPKKGTNNKQAASNKKKKQSNNKQPMTLISHILPNGEKVEINVQLSGKNDGGGVLEIESPYGDSYVADEEPEENTEDIDGQQQQQPVADLVDDPLEVDAEGDDPAISASYELAGEKLEDDHRKPSPSHIFNKLNKRKKKKKDATSTVPPTVPPSTTTTTPLPPKYIVSKKKRPLKTTTTVWTPTRRPTRRPTKPSPTPAKRRTPPTWATTQYPPPRPNPTRQPTVSPRSSTTRSPPSLKSSKGKVTTTTAFTTTSTTTLRPKPRPKNKPTTTAITSIEVEEFSEEEKNTTPTTWSKIAASKGILPSSLKSSGSNTRKKATSSSSKHTHPRDRPSLYNDGDSPSPKITIEIDNSDETNNSNNSNSESEEEEEKVVGSTTSEPIIIISTTTRKPNKPKTRPTTTVRSTTTTTTTPSPLSLLTQSHYDQVIADMFRSTRPPARKTSPLPTTMAPTSKRRRKPINYNKKSQYFHNGQIFVGYKNNSTTMDETTYGMSVESGSGEVRPFNMAQLGDIGNPNPWTEVGHSTPTTTTKDPPTHDMDDPTDVGGINPGKKRIVYKNGKRPYLVLMKPGNGGRLGRPNQGQLSPTMTAADMNHNSHHQSYHESPSIQTQGQEQAVPLVIEPGTHSSDYSHHWTPNY